MKKTLGVLGVVAFATAMFFTTNKANGSATETTLSNLLTLNSANAECIPANSSSAPAGCSFGQVCLLGGGGQRCHF